jgi:DNA-binding PadR family transcriptional regulator
MARRLTTTSYAILGLLATRPMSGYDLAGQYPRSMRWAWPLSQAHLYSEPKRLAAAGLVRVEHVAAGPRRRRQEFHITTRGRRALRDWLTTAVDPPALNNEVMLRVAFADHGSVDDLVAALDDVAAKLDAIYAEGIAQVEGYVRDGGPFPQRLHLIALASDFHARFVELCQDWVADTRDEVRSWETTADLGLTKRSRARLAAVLERAAERVAAPPASSGRHSSSSARTASPHSTRPARRTSA